MLYIRSTLISVLFIVVAIAGYFYFVFGSSEGLDSALDDFQKGNIEESQLKISHLSRELPKAQLRLYQSYLQRAQHRLTKSNEALEEAASLAKIDSNKNLLLEIYLNQALNSYLTDDLPSLTKAIENAKTVSPSNQWINFFTMIENFCQEDRQHMEGPWEANFPEKALSGWMKKSFDQTFTPQWLAMRTSQCQIEEGKYALARETLKDLTLKATANDMNQIYFLLGYSYIKEAEGKPASAVSRYYKLAFSSFDHLPILQEEYSKERAKVSKQIQQVVFSLIKENTFENLSFYLASLQKLQATQELSQINKFLIAVLSEDIQAQKWSHLQQMVHLLSTSMVEGESRNQISKLFERMAEQSISSGDLTHYAFFLQTAKEFTSNEPQLLSNISKKIEKKIAELINDDDQNLSGIYPYISLWESIEKDPDERLQFANTLLNFSNRYWNGIGQEVKALNLMKLASTIPMGNDRVVFQEAISKSIQRIYVSTSKTDNVEKFPYLLEAVRTLKLSNVDFRDKKTIANYLTDAKFLYEQKRINEANKIAEWVLQLDINDQEARYITAMHDYYAADYVHAIENFSHLKDLNNQSLECLAVCQIVAGDYQAGIKLLDQLNQKKPISPEVFTRIGLGFLAAGKYEEGVHWLSRVDNPDSEVFAGLVYGEFRLQKWDAVIRSFDRLAFPLNKLPSLQGLAILSYITLNNDEGADKIFQDMSVGVSELPLSSLNPPFISFKEKQLDKVDINYIASIYYRKVKHQPEIALQYLQNIDKPSNEILLDRGELSTSLGNYELAQKDLSELQTKSIDPIVARKALALLASSYYNFNQFPEAIRTFRQYFSEDNADPKYLKEYIGALIQAQRYDLALALYQKLSSKDMTKDDLVQVINCYVHTNQFDKARKKTQEILARNPSLPIVNLLQLAKLMIIMEARDESSAIAKKISVTGVISPEETSEYLSFLLLTANYKEAIDFASAKKAVLKKDVKGLMVLASLQARLSLNDEAIALAKQARKLASEDLSIFDFIIRYESNISSLENLSEDLATKLSLNNHDVVTQLAYAESLMQLVIESHGKNKLSDQNISDLNKASFLLRQLSEAYSDLPKVHFLKGQYLLLSGNMQEAFESFNKALLLDVSYSDAYKFQGIVLENLSKAAEAQQAVKNALKYTPDDAEAWQELYEMMLARGKDFESIACLQNAIKFRPNEVKNYLKLGQLYLSIDSPDQARDALENAVKLSPDNLEALKLLLRALYSSKTSAVGVNLDKLHSEQSLLYQKIHELDPKAAEELLEDLTRKVQ